MNAETLLQRGNAHLIHNSQWNDANHTIERVSMARSAIDAVRPHGDHLLAWLVETTASAAYADQAWVNEVLKEALWEQRPEISVAWLDQQLPSNQERYDDE